jgi:hypothetical protein
MAHTRESHGRPICFFHVSPDGDIGKMRGRWHARFQERGIFVSPTYRSIVLDWFQHAAGKKRGARYKVLTVYRLTIPKPIVEACIRRYERSAHGFLYEGPVLHGFRDWGDELWIPEQHLRHVRISGRKTISCRELTRQYSRRIAKRAASRS